MRGARSPPPRRSGASSRTSACRAPSAWRPGAPSAAIFGSDLRREYTLHGEVVNLASRLMEASARRDPLLRRDRAGGARERRLRGAGAGHAEGTRRAGGGAPRIVDAQRRQRPRVADGRARGRAGGDQGADRRPGDRRPLGHRRHRGRAPGWASRCSSREAIRLARARGVRVLTAAADAVENATSYYAWRSMFTDLLEVTPQTMVDPHSLEVPCDPELRRMRPLLSSIVPVGIPDNELTGAMDGSVRAENTKLLLASILRHTTAAGARPGGRRGRPLAGLQLVGAAAGDRAVGAAGPGRGHHAPDERPARAVRAAARAGVDRGPRAWSR